MKKFILIVVTCAFVTNLASAQTNYIPTYSAGIKGGADYSMFPGSGDVHNKNQFGYIGGFWGRIGGKGLFFQPELYYTSRNVTASQLSGGVLYLDNAQFTSVDVPLLVGGKVGDANIGARFYTGPVLSLAISKWENFFPNNSNLATHFNYHDENIAWQFGAGVDISSFSLDVRYEYGINKVPFGPTKTSSTRLNMVNLTLAYTLFTAYY